MQYKTISVVTFLLCAFSVGGSWAVDNEIAPQNDGRQQLEHFLEAYKQHEQLPFAEDYSDPLLGVSFHVRYKNEAVKNFDAGPLLKQSSITLDSKRYPYSDRDPRGFFMQAGADETFMLSPDSYVPRVKRGVSADSLRRWRWVSAIPPGEHTLSLQFGGKQYGPVRYNQPGTGAWNVARD